MRAFEAAAREDGSTPPKIDTTAAILGKVIDRLGDRTGIVNGVNTALALIVDELDAKGLVSKEALATRLERAAQEAAERAAAKGTGNGEADRRRVDLVLLRNLAQLLRTPTPQREPLTVIEGGKPADQAHEQ